MTRDDESARTARERSVVDDGSAGAQRELPFPPADLPPRPAAGEPAPARGEAPEAAEARRWEAAPAHPVIAAHPRVHKHPVLTRGAAICGVLTLVIIGLDLTPEAFAGGFLLAIVPVPLYVVLALWLDRFEPEPTRVLAQTFAWGATVAVFVAIVANTVFGGVVAEVAGEDAGEFFAAVFSAPVVEELAKGFALFVLFKELKDEFDGVIDGIVYAAMVGLGFAMIENVQYYGQALMEGGETSVLTFFMRGMMSPFAHPFFTAMFGIGLGYARERHGHGGSWAAPVVGLGLAIGLHALWNLGASSGEWFFALYVFVMLPTFLGVLVLVYVSLRREGRLVRDHLGHLVPHGVLTPDELHRLSVVRTRLAASTAALLAEGVHGWRRRREKHRIASELAFHRWRVNRGLTMGPEADALREREYLDRLRELYRERERERSPRAR